MNQQIGKTGRSWSVVELRAKSFDDLRKLWFVLLKERNMLYTYRFQCRRNKTKMEHQERIMKVRLSMAAIRCVIGERAREYKYATNPTWVSIQEKKKAERRRIRHNIRKSHSGPTIKPKTVPSTHSLKKKIVFAELKPSNYQVPMPHIN